jgi:integrase
MAWLKDIKWPFRSAIFDGEGCAGDGHEGIQAVFAERKRRGGDMALVLFDLLYLGGDSVMREPWRDRRKPLLTGEPGRRLLNGYSDPMGISLAFRRLARRLGIRDLRFHDLRHDLGTRLARNRQSQRVIMKVLGHRDPRVSVRYTHAAEETVREALNELG